MAHRGIAHGMKTGCATEQRQLETAHALQNFLAFATIVACKAVSARRRPAPNPRRQPSPHPLQMTVLCGLRLGSKRTVSPAKPPGNRRHGGFMGRKGDGNPGCVLSGLVSRSSSWLRGLPGRPIKIWVMMSREKGGLRCILRGRASKLWGIPPRYG